VKYAWIAKHKALWPISVACEALEVSTSGYFEHWRRKDTSKPSGPGTNRRISDEALLVHIRAIHAEVKQEYGWPKMWKQLLAQGVRVGKERVRKLMQRHGIKARGKRKFVVTTDSKHDLAVAPNLLQRNFTPASPNAVWAGDITYIATDEGWLYLAVVIDLFSRMVVGWSMKPHMQASLVTDALRMASGSGPDLPLGPRQSVLQPRVPQGDCRLRHAVLDEPQGRLLGQRADREPVGSSEGRSAVRKALRHATRSDGRSDRLAELLQPWQIALDAGLRQSHDVRATLDRGPAARQEVRIIGSLWSAENRGKVNGAAARSLKPICPLNALLVSVVIGFRIGQKAFLKTRSQKREMVRICSAQIARSLSASLPFISRVAC
jgi:hypothetical protein